MSDRIYCIMVTGKDEKRLKYAKQSCINFLNQSHDNKMLLIFNHNEHSVDKIENIDNILEFSFDINIYNLGAIKNVALSMIPIGALWTIWDDDDYRSGDFLSTLYNSLILNDGVACTITNRIDYNINTHFAYKASKSDGFVTILCRNFNNVKYLEKKTMEDLDLLQDIRKNGKIVLLDNNPLLYIRLLHDSNTSLYVRKNKDKITNYTGVYTEENVDKGIINLVENIIKVNILN